MLLQGGSLLCLSLLEPDLVVSNQLVLQGPDLVLCLEDDLRAIEPKLVLVQEPINLARVEILDRLSA